MHGNRAINFRKSLQNLAYPGLLFPPRLRVNSDNPVRNYCRKTYSRQTETHIVRDVYDISGAQVQQPGVQSEPSKKLLDASEGRLAKRRKRERS